MYENNSLPDVLNGSFICDGMMQDLDVQNAAAGEQHAKDMAEYDAKVAEAAAAWEADKKKRKGKAKDEASSWQSFEYQVISSQRCFLHCKHARV